jgi:hypothetical protein
MSFKIKIASLLPPLLPLILSMGLVETAVRLGWAPLLFDPGTERSHAFFNR